MKVRNMTGTSDNVCKCGSWLDHWKNFSGQSMPTYCVEEKCLKSPEVGAHVRKAESSDKDWYIVPFCKDHNKSTDALEIPNSAKLVSADVSQTCGK